MKVPTLRASLEIPNARQKISPKRLILFSRASGDLSVFVFIATGLVLDVARGFQEPLRMIDFHPNSFLKTTLVQF